MGTYVDGKGYLSICAGPQRGIRLHRLIAEAKMGRKLRRDEVVHHRDGNKLNCSPDNLEVMGERERNAVSAKQQWFMKKLEAFRKAEFDAYYGDEGGGYGSDVNREECGI